MAVPPAPVHPDDELEAADLREDTGPGTEATAADSARGTPPSIPPPIIGYSHAPGSPIGPVH